MGTCWKLYAAKVWQLLLERIIHRSWCSAAFIWKKTHPRVLCNLQPMQEEVWGFFWYSKYTNFISTCAYYKTVMAAGACCPEVSLHRGPCWNGWGICVPVSLYLWRILLLLTNRKSYVQIYFHYSASVSADMSKIFFVKNKCFFSHLKKCLLQLAWTSSFYEFSGDVSV